MKYNKYDEKLFGMTKPIGVKVKKPTQKKTTAKKSEKKK